MAGTLSTRCEMRFWGEVGEGVVFSWGRGRGHGRGYVRCGMFFFIGMGVGGVLFHGGGGRGGSLVLLHVRCVVLLPFFFSLPALASRKN